jgi:hypothetical protein
MPAGDGRGGSKVEHGMRLAVETGDDDSDMCEWIREGCGGDKGKGK